MARRKWAVAALVAVLAAGCGEQSADVPAGSPVVVDQGDRGARGLTPQEAFLARIKQASRGNDVIADARMNRDDELGVVLGRQVKLDQVRDLMTTLLREMRDEFPGRPLTVLAYAPNGQHMATMRYDPSVPPDANVTYTPKF